VSRSPAALLLRCAAKVTAHLHGACVGAGIELAAFAGRVTAAPDTVIRLPEIGMGLIPGAGGTASLPVRVGRERTAYLALSGAALTAAEALRWGLVNEITESRWR
jgi:enoyl-CoA hydratase/carnithine racemase